jgi:hypothetical protein
MTKLLYDVLENTSIAISIVPLLCLGLTWKRAGTPLRWLFFILLIVELITETSNRILTWNHINNFFVCHIYTVIYSILLYFIYKNYISSIKLIGWFRIITLILVLSGVYEGFINNGYLKINTMTYLLLCIQSIIYSLVFFYDLINEARIKNLKLYSPFWINSGVLFFFGTTFCLTLFEGYILKYNADLLYYTWSVQLIANIVYHLILSRGIWLMRRT